MNHVANGVKLSWHGKIVCQCHWKNNPGGWPRIRWQILTFSWWRKIRETFHLNHGAIGFLKNCRSKSSFRKYFYYQPCFFYYQRTYFKTTAWAWLIMAEITYNNGGQTAPRRHVLDGSSSWIAISQIIKSCCLIFNVCFVYQCVYTNSYG